MAEEKPSDSNKSEGSRTGSRRRYYRKKKKPSTGGGAASSRDDSRNKDSRSGDGADKTTETKSGEGRAGGGRSSESRSGRNRSSRQRSEGRRSGKNRSGARSGGRSGRSGGERRESAAKDGSGRNNSGRSSSGRSSSADRSQKARRRRRDRRSGSKEAPQTSRRSILQEIEKEYKPPESVLVYTHVVQPSQGGSAYEFRADHFSKTGRDIEDFRIDLSKILGRIIDVDPDNPPKLEWDWGLIDEEYDDEGAPKSDAPEPDYVEVLKTESNDTSVDTDQISTPEPLAQDDVAATKASDAEVFDTKEQANQSNHEESQNP